MHPHSGTHTPSVRHTHLQVLDLEALANHKGSTFGALPFQLTGRRQPSNQVYWHTLAVAWARLDPGRWIYVEDEGPHVGKVAVPPPFYGSFMRRCSLVVRLIVPKPVRTGLLMQDYASPALRGLPGWDKAMRDNLERAAPRMGAELTAITLRLFDSDDGRGVVSALLGYYDLLYDRHIASQHGTGAGTGSRGCKIIDLDMPLVAGGGGSGGGADADVLVADASLPPPPFEGLPPPPMASGSGEGKEEGGGEEVRCGGDDPCDILNVHGLANGVLKLASEEAPLLLQK